MVKEIFIIDKSNFALILVNDDNTLHSLPSLLFSKYLRLEEPAYLFVF